MSKRLVALRYVKALAKIAEDSGNLIEVQRELTDITNKARNNADLKQLIFYPLLIPKKKAATMDAVLTAMGISTIVSRFFYVLAEANRLDLIYELSSVFDEVVNEKMGIVEASVQTAQPMLVSQMEALTEVLVSRTGKKIKLNWQQDNSLIGGLKVQVGSIVYDASVQGQLSLFKANLLLV